MFITHINLDSFQINRNITGVIYFEQDGKFYPQKNWNDFAVIISSWWTYEFFQFIKKNKKSCEFLFMDGHYSMLIERNKNKLRLRFLDSKDELIWQGNEPVETILLDLIILSDKITTYCKSQNWETNDTKSLELNLKMLKSIKL